jgi:hypothetical protein
MKSKLIYETHLCLRHVYMLLWREMNRWSHTASSRNVLHPYLVNGWGN